MNQLADCIGAKVSVSGQNSPCYVFFLRLPTGLFIFAIGIPSFFLAGDHKKKNLSGK